MGMMQRLKGLIGGTARELGYEIRKIRSAPPAPAGAVAVPDGVRGVHDGCGTLIVPGWLNLDYAPPAAGIGPGLHFLPVDLSLGHPFADGSFSFGYAEDFLEHLSQAQSLQFLDEAHRTLRRGGVLRLSFPGLEGVLRKHYVDGSLEVMRQAQWDAYDKWGHVHFCAREELRLVATHLGFSAVEFQSFQESAIPELGQMDSRAAQSDLNTYAELTR